jgi:hypothetical protein
MTTGILSQSIYYAKNVMAAAAGTNSVTVTFVTAATNPDVRILEYSGVSTTSALDVVVGRPATVRRAVVASNDNEFH